MDQRNKKTKNEMFRTYDEINRANPCKKARLKNDSRSIMIKNRLNGVALLRIHQEIVPTENDIIQKFALDGAGKQEFL